MTNTSFWILLFLSSSVACTPPDFRNENDGGINSYEYGRNEQRKLHDQAFAFASSQIRSLQDGKTCEEGADWVIVNQVNSSCSLGSPDQVCETYNAALAGRSLCECSRSDKSDVLMTCNDVEPLCNEVQTWCAYSGLTQLLDRKGNAQQTISTTNVSIVIADEGEVPISTRVQIFPESNGNFGTVVTCNADLNGEACTCTPCTPEQHEEKNGDIATTQNVTASVTVDCCSVQDGAIATCTPVSPRGLVVVQFDAVEQGVCVAGESSSYTRIHNTFPVLFGSFVSMMVLLLVPLL